MFSRSPLIPICINFKTKAFSNTLSKAMNISRKIPLSASPSSRITGVIA